MMMRAMMLCLAVLQVACGGGGVPASTPPPPAPVAVPSPVLDTSTPDRAVKAYWIAVDEKRKMQFDRAKAYLENDPTRARQLQVSTPEFVGPSKFEAVFESYSRDILDVKVESESRAVVTAQIKNITPIPAGAEMSKYDEKQRREGDRVRYVLENSKEGWRVSELWEWEDFQGVGWKKVWPADPKPTVPTFTFNAR